jgi:hypothetical protein
MFTIHNNIQYYITRNTDSVVNYTTNNISVVHLMTLIVAETIQRSMLRLVNNSLEKEMEEFFHGQIWGAILEFAYKGWKDTRTTNQTTGVYNNCVLSNIRPSVSCVTSLVSNSVSYLRNQHDQGPVTVLSCVSNCGKRMKEKAVLFMMYVARLQLPWPYSWTRILHCLPSVRFKHLV